MIRPRSSIKHVWNKAHCQSLLGIFETACEWWQRNEKCGSYNTENKK